MEQVAVIVAGILSATGMLVGASLAAEYVVARWNDIAAYGSVAAAIGAMLVIMLLLIAIWSKRQRFVHFKFDREQGRRDD